MRPFPPDGCSLQRLEADYKSVTDKEKEAVVKLGGLHVVGTERHVSPLHLGSSHTSAQGSSPNCASLAQSQQIHKKGRL